DDRTGRHLRGPRPAAQARARADPRGHDPSLRDPGRYDPRRPDRPGCARPGPDRIRQDPGVRPADAGSRRPQRPRPPPPPPAPPPHRPKGLLRVPTRELAMQVADALRPLGRELGLFLATAVGGVPYDRQITGLQRGLDVLIATPGRLGDLINRGACSLDDIEISVLDEADQMADMGFLPEVTDLLDKTPKGAQRLLFSATLDGDVDALVQRFMTDPVTHSTQPAAASVTTMDHLLLMIPPAEKFRVLASIAAR